MEEEQQTNQQEELAQLLASMTNALTPEQENAWLRGQLAERDRLIQTLETLQMLRTAETQAVITAMGELTVKVNTLMIAVNETLTRIHLDVLNVPDFRSHGNRAN